DNGIRRDVLVPKERAQLGRARPHPVIYALVEPHRQVDSPDARWILLYEHRCTALVLRNGSYGDDHRGRGVKLLAPRHSIALLLQRVCLIRPRAPAPNAL